METDYVGDRRVFVKEARARLKVGTRQLAKYTQSGVLPEPNRTPSGFRWWTELAIQDAVMKVTLRRTARAAKLASNAKRVSKADIDEAREAEHSACVLWKSKGIEALQEELAKVRAPSPADIMPFARRAFIASCITRSERGWR